MTRGAVAPLVCMLKKALLYCTCMMVWFSVTPSMNSCEYCVYYNGYVDRMITSTTYFGQIIVLS